MLQNVVAGVNVNFLHPVSLLSTTRKRTAYIRSSVCQPRPLSTPCFFLRECHHFGNSAGNGHVQLLPPPIDRDRARQAPHTQRRVLVLQRSYNGESTMSMLSPLLPVHWHPSSCLQIKLAVEYFQRASTTKIRSNAILEHGASRPRVLSPRRGIDARCMILPIVVSRSIVKVNCIGGVARTSLLR